MISTILIVLGFIALVLSLLAALGVVGVSWVTFLIIGAVLLVVGYLLRGRRPTAV